MTSRAEQRKPTAWKPAAAVERTIASSGFSGIVAVDAGDQPLYRASAGSAHRASAIPNSIGTRFAISSGSKAFTASAIMRLNEDGLLDLDSPVRSLLEHGRASLLERGRIGAGGRGPGDRLSGGGLPLLDPQLTVRQLLTHSGGLEDYLEESEDSDPNDFVLDVPVHTLTTAEDFLPLLATLRQSSAPGSGFAYSNAGYVILALVIERLTQQNFQDAVADLVFAPARLHDTAYLRLDELPAGTATGYLGAEGDRANTLHLPVRGNGDGGAFTTASDLHRFWLALFAGEILSPASVRSRVAPRFDVPEENLRYGMGFWLEPTGAGVVMEGCDAGVSFRSTHHPQTGLTVTVVSNTTEGAWPVVRATL